MKIRQRIIRRMGFVRDQEGIMNRYIREKANWDQHLEKTREFINASFNNNNHSIFCSAWQWMVAGCYTG